MLPVLIFSSSLHQLIKQQQAKHLEDWKVPKNRKPTAAPKQDDATSLCRKQHLEEPNVTRFSSLATSYTP